MAFNLDALGLSATVTAQGISAPDYQTILGSITDYFRQIYGADAYLEPDSKDGQMVALMALAIHDANNTAISVYNSFSPATALSGALSSNVKINGIKRQSATFSGVDLLLTGEPGTEIINGVAVDSNGARWNLPDNVVIGIDGTLSVTATCSLPGAVAALSGSITQIATPTRGWTSVTNPLAASVGTAAETDPELRARQSRSVALSALTPFVALDGAIASINGVTRHKLYENDTGAIDKNDIPGHSLAAIVEGGDLLTIAQVIRGKKGQGVSTWGTQTALVTDLYGNPHFIHFSRPTNVPVFVAITLKAFQGYTSQIGEQIKNEVANYLNSLGIGDDVLISRLYSPANLGVTSGGNARYYDIVDLRIGITRESRLYSNITIPYDHVPMSHSDNITITVTL